MRKLFRLALGAMALGVMFGFAGYALAQASAPAVGDFIQAACANNGALLTQGIAWIGGTVGAASLLANLRKYIPAPVMQAVDVLALNWVKAEAAQAAPPAASAPAQKS